MSARPRYPFGHGLSYTTFAYSPLRADADEIPTDGAVTVSATITNTGTRAGTETVQLYAAHRGALVTRPAQELAGFCRVALGAGESATVKFTVSTGQLAYLGVHDTFVFDPGPLHLSIGASSDDIRATATVDVVGPTADWSVRRPLFSGRVVTRTSTMSEV